VSFLDLPIDYSNSTFAEVANGNVGGQGPGRVNSWFDHTWPNYKLDRVMLTWSGETYFGQETNIGVKNCAIGVTCYDGHNGIDFQQKLWPESVYAVATGIVTDVNRNWPKSIGTRGSSYGNYVLIDHGNGYATLYAHLAQINDSVVKGKLITDTKVISLGLIGGSGGWEPHLHFGVYYDANGNGQWEERFQGYSEAVDPYGWMDQFPEFGPFDPWSIPSFYLWKSPLNFQQPTGSGGGRLTSLSGNATFDVPPGALTSTMTLEVWDMPPFASASAQLHSTGHSYRFGVLEWLQFDISNNRRNISHVSNFSYPITVTIAYSDTQLLHLNKGQLTIYQRNTSTSAFMPLSTTVNIITNRVVAQMTATGDLDLRAPLMCPTDVQEPNDNYSAGTLLVPNSTLQNQRFDILKDEDWFRLETSAGAKYTLWTGDLTTGVDTVLEIYDTDGVTVLTLNDNDGNNAASLVEWYAPASGIYFIRITRAPNSSYGCDASYSMSVVQEVRAYFPLIRK
jgi:murein DD-endopeptidase MepM/ murein hydrolase activator NlpD